MTTEEIEKAAIEYTSNLRGELNKEMAASWFIIGAMYSNTNWQEKTRWIPIEERLPPRGTETRQVFVKGTKNKHYLNWMIVSCFEDDYLNDIDFIKGEFTHWKEIEL